MSEFTRIERAIHACLRGEAGALFRQELQMAIEDESFTPDALQTAYMEGQRAFARKLLTAWRRVEQGEEADG